MGSLHHPSTCFKTSFPLDGLGFFSTLTNMSGEAEFAQDVAHLIIVIPFVQTHSLWPLCSWLWALNDDAFNRRTDQLHIMAIGPLNCQTEGNSVPLGQQTAFDSAFATIGR